MDTIKLRKPLLVDGEETGELAYDYDLITSDAFIEAEQRVARKAADKGMYGAKTAESDAGFHFELGVQAILAANPGMMAEDVERVTGPDIFAIARIGRTFMIAGAAGDAGEDSSGIPDGDGEPEEDAYAYGLGIPE